MTNRNVAKSESELARKSEVVTTVCLHVADNKNQSVALLDWDESSGESSLTYLSHFFLFLRKLPVRRINAWCSAAKRGWFVNRFMPSSILKYVYGESEFLDQKIINHLREDWHLIASNILERYPHRRHVLSCAFEHHQAGCFISSVPLIITQIDGIFAEEMGVYLFSERGRRMELLDKKINMSNGDFSHWLEIFKEDLQFGRAISSSKLSQKNQAPNRNGILHGSRQHLDFGTEINSYKAFSLLAFVAFIFQKLKAN